MTETELKAEMRIFVLESMTALLWASSHMNMPDPVASLTNVRNKLLEKARNQTFAGVDPSQSDLLSAELEAAVERAIAIQAKWMGVELP